MDFLKSLAEEYMENHACCGNRASRCHFCRCMFSLQQLWAV